MSDIGAISPGRWQATQDRWRIGATSFVNVTCPAAGCVCAAARAGATAAVATTAKNAQLLCLNEPADCILNLTFFTFFVPCRSGVKPSM